MKLQKSFIVLCAVFCVSSAGAATQIADPVKFVQAQYTHAEIADPDDIYSPRIAALFALDKKEAGTDVGRIDFSIWMDGQEGPITDAKVTGVSVDNAPDREVVVAKFKNHGAPREVHFYFEKIGGAWKLDDARSFTGERWVLSLILKYGWTGDQPN